MRSPGDALDYPNFPSDDLWVIWTGNQYDWPDARRTLFYLDRIRKGVMTGSALITMFPADAYTFETEAEARATLAENERLRGSPYYNMHVTTVGQLKQMKGYT